MQIGAGIFSAPSQISQHVLSLGVGILIWPVGGLLVWTGASVFIELGLTVTQNGGIQEYLRACYGDMMGFIFTWTWVTISKPASMAIIVRVFAEHLCRAAFPDQWMSESLIKVISLAGMWLITIINCAGTITGVKVANGFLALKLLAVISVAVIGLIATVSGHGAGVEYGTKGRGWFDRADFNDLQKADTWAKVGNYVTAFFGALYSFGGWESVSVIPDAFVNSLLPKQTGFVVGEMDNAQRNLPRVMNSAVAMVTVAFTAINVALYLILPISVIRSEYTPVLVGLHHIHRRRLPRLIHQ